MRLLPRAPPPGRDGLDRSCPGERPGTTAPGTASPGTCPVPRCGPRAPRSGTAAAVTWPACISRCADWPSGWVRDLAIVPSIQVSPPAPVQLGCRRRRAGADEPAAGRLDPLRGRSGQQCPERGRRRRAAAHGGPTSWRSPGPTALRRPPTATGRNSPAAAGRSPTWRKPLSGRSTGHSGSAAWEIHHGRETGKYDVPMIERQLSMTGAPCP
jgi:hypothetical protein